MSNLRTLSANKKTGAQIVEFLKSFEGAASAFSDDSDTWALWIPEIATGEFPVTPGSQVYFPVILRNGPQLVAIRFFYDCRTGKIKFYTGSIPSHLAALPEFDHAVSELFRHSLPVESIKQRPLRRSQLPAPAASNFRPSPRKEEPVRPVSSIHEEKKREPASQALQPQIVTPVTKVQESKIVVSSSPATLEKQKPIAPFLERPIPPEKPISLATTMPVTQHQVHVETPRKSGIRIEICDSTRHVLQALILVIGVLGIAILAAYVYLQINEDPGLKHHRMQLEQMKIRSKT